MCMYNNYSAGKFIQNWVAPHLQKKSEKHTVLKYVLPIASLEYTSEISDHLHVVKTFKNVGWINDPVHTWPLNQMKSLVLISKVTTSGFHSNI